MTIQLAPDGTIRLEGESSLDDAEQLQRLLVANPGAAVDWTSCAFAHTAVIQILLSAGRELRGPPRSDFLRIHIDALLAQRPD